jgi:glutathione synthase/RimK-type ligase-like ATP-grasp enzyme
VIVVWGSVDDAPVARVLDALDERPVETVHLDDRALGAISYSVRIGPRAEGWIDVGDRRIDLDEIDGVYLRPGEQHEAASAAASATLIAVAGSIPAVVVNRPAAGRSNLSKPFQLSLIAAAGIATPETLVTSDAIAAREFLARHRRIVYKSISGRRSIVTAVEATEPERLDRIGHGPVQFQQWIEGLDVRVHVVGDRWFATSVASPATDYRYAPDAGASVEIAPFDLPDALGRQLVTVSQGMGLMVAGIDLRRCDDGRWFCFEVNPSPGFTYYEGYTAQPIAGAIAELLTSGR